MTGVEARVIAVFYSPRAIPAGYDTSVGISDASLKNPIGYIDVEFNTQDNLINQYTGWNLNLVSGAPVNPFTCKSFAGLVAKTG